MGAEGTGSFLGAGSVQGLELDSMVLVDPCQFGMFCDSVVLVRAPGYKGTTQKHGAEIDLIPEDTTNDIPGTGPVPLHPFIPGKEPAQTLVLLLLAHWAFQKAKK